jgi:hypothetical protein
MLRFIADENFNGAIVRGVFRICPDIDLLTVREASIAGISDPALLDWAAGHQRLVLTHDVRTMPAFVQERVSLGLSMPGVIEVPAICPIRQVIEEIGLFYNCSIDGEWEGQIIRIPL